MIINAAFMTHRGSVREENQDAIFVSGSVRAGNMDAPEICTINPKKYPILFAVIDGMGGHKGGALAAKILADTLAEETDKKGLFGTQSDIGEDEPALRGLLVRAVQRMEKEVETDSSLSEMGATVSGVLFRENNALAFNCGDCRVYHFSEGRFERVTRDHSIVQELFEQDEISEDEMRNHPRKNIVTSVISPFCRGEFDLYVRELTLCEGDILFLCSDGAWEVFPSRKLKELITLNTPQRIFNALLDAKCRDNISFILCRIKYEI